MLLFTYITPMEPHHRAVASCQKLPPPTTYLSITCDMPDDLLIRGIASCLDTIYLVHVVVI